MERTSQQHGRDAEDRALALLRGLGLCANSTRGEYRNRKYDILCGGKRIEVKTARCRSVRSISTKWAVNIHRGGELDESQVDYYLVEIFNNAPEFYLLIPAPVKRKSLAFSLRQLSGKSGKFRWAPYLNNFEPLLQSVAH